MVENFRSKVIKRENLTDYIVFFSFEVPENFSFKAGQFLSIIVEKDGQRKIRAYSIASPPSKKRVVDLVITIVEGGFASEVFDKTQVGDEFDVKGPMGHFIFDENSINDEYFFIGTGTGVAPLHSMIKEFLPILPDKEFRLIFGARKRYDLIYHQEFLEMEKKYPNFKYIPTLTREDWDGATGRVQTHLDQDLKGKTFYICGLKEMVLQTKELLLGKGVKKEDIKFERYN